MNAKTVTALILTVLLSSPALAGGRVLMEVDCQNRVRPGLQQFAAQAGIDNASEAYRIRSKAWTEVSRACHRGLDRVRLVQNSHDGSTELQLVRR